MCFLFAFLFCLVSIVLFVCLFLFFFSSLLGVFLGFLFRFVCLFFVPGLFVRFLMAPYSLILGRRLSPLQKKVLETSILW